VSDWFGATAQSGSLVLAVPVALVAGLVSFFSPCVLPLIPAYFSYATGLSAADLAQQGTARAHRSRMLAGSVLFVLGFSVVFVMVGVAFGTMGTLLWEHRRTLAVVLGVVNILLGLAFLGMVPALQREWRIGGVPAVGVAAAPVLGFLFGLGWTPCIGPTLGVISTLAATEGTAARGAALSAFYALGMGIPFILGGLAYERLLGAAAVVRRHMRVVNTIGGLLLIAVGVLLVTGWWDVLTDRLQTWFVEAGIWETAL
jgi:cytochrome c-type biogenesis protein